MLYHTIIRVVFVVWLHDYESWAESVSRRRCLWGFCVPIYSRFDVQSKRRREHENKKTTPSTRVYTGIKICCSKQQFSMLDMHIIITVRMPDFLKEAFNVTNNSPTKAEYVVEQCKLYCSVKCTKFKKDSRELINGSPTRPHVMRDNSLLYTQAPGGTDCGEGKRSGSWTDIRRHAACRTGPQQGIAEPCSRHTPVGIQANKQAGQQQRRRLKFKF